MRETTIWSGMFFAKQSKVKLTQIWAVTFKDIGHCSNTSPFSPFPSLQFSIFLNKMAAAWLWRLNPFYCVERPSLRNLKSIMASCINSNLSVTILDILFHRKILNQVTIIVYLFIKILVLLIDLSSKSHLYISLEEV